MFSLCSSEVSFRGMGLPVPQLGSLIQFQSTACPMAWVWVPTPHTATLYFPAYRENAENSPENPSCTGRLMASLYASSRSCYTSPIPPPLATAGNRIGGTYVPFCDCFRFPPDALRKCVYRRTR